MKPDSRRGLDRRTFLKGVGGTAGLVFVGCGVTEAAAQSSDRSTRRPLVVKGRRIRTVDVHAHCVVTKASELLRGGSSPSAAATQGLPLVLDGQALDRRIADMDAQGIDIAVLSINPNWYSADRELATQVIAIQNEAMAAFCASARGSFCGIRLCRAAVSRPRGAAAGAGHEDVGVPRSGDWRQRRRPGAVGRGVPSVLGQSRGARRCGLHPSAGVGVRRAQRQAEGQRDAGQRHRKSARDHDRALAPDFRGHARSFPGREDLRGARRRLPAVLHEPLGSRLHDVSRAVHSWRPEARADRVREADVLRFARLHAGGAASSRGRSRREPRADGHRLSVPLGERAGRPRARHARAHRPGSRSHSGRNREDVAEPFACSGPFEFLHRGPDSRARALRSTFSTAWLPSWQAYSKMR